MLLDSSRLLTRCLLLAAAGSLPLRLDAVCLAPPSLDWRVVGIFLHDPTSFTQGLVWHDGRLFESSGIKGQSRVSELDSQSGQLRQQRRLPAEIFAEGLTWHGDKLWQLSWKSGISWRRNPDTLIAETEFRYVGEGWGLTSDGQHLWMSDGSATLQIREPTQFQLASKRIVRWGERPLRNLNELEWIDDQLWANIWRTTKVVRIDPASGCVTGYLELARLKARDRVGKGRHDVLNGIAWDAAQRQLLVTGKWWNRVYRLEVPGMNAAIRR